MLPWRNLKRFYQKTLKQPGYAFKVVTKRLQAYFYYFYSEGRSCFPEAITLFLTHRCNLRCKMCGQWGEGGVTGKQSAQYIQEELSLTELKQIIDDVSIGQPNITLFGGEPLLYQGTPELIRYIKQKGMHCLMITNGFLVENMAEAIVESGLDELNVSLDGGRDLHDQIRGMSGLFDKIMSGLKETKKLKEQKNTKKPLVNLQCTISKFNYLFLEQLIAVAIDAGVDSLTFHNLIFLNYELIEKQKSFDQALHNSSEDWQGFVFEPGIVPEILYEKIKRIRSRKYPFNLDFYPNFSEKGLIEYYRNPMYMPKEFQASCLSPWTVAYIFPDGEIRPCLNFSFSFGNIKKDKFADIWNGQQAVHFRSMLKKNKAFPVCVRCTELYRY